MTVPQEREDFYNESKSKSNSYDGIDQELSSIGVNLNTLLSNRNEILSQVSLYCAGLSQDFLIEFDDQIGSKIKSLLIDIKVAENYRILYKQVQDNNIDDVADEIIEDLKAMVEYDPTYKPHFINL